jgi:tetratricopeptide (TPR) repeat protein
VSLILRTEGGQLWCNAASRPLGDTDRALLHQLSARYRVWTRRHGEPLLRGIGEELHEWLGAWKVELVGTDLLEVRASTSESSLLDAPWELMHDGSGFLVDCGLEVIRRIAPPGEGRPRSGHALSMLFMAASPTGQQRLHFEEEEQAIVQATHPSRLDLWVEETGCVRDLGARLDRMLALGPVDVLHLTCHGTADGPGLLLENEVGALDRVSPDALAREVRLRELGLCVVSACETSVLSPLADTFAQALVRLGAPAALGWAAPVSDQQATVFVAAFYERLARGWTLPDALRHARRHLRHTTPSGSDWHLARLVVGARGGGALAMPGGPLRASPEAGTRAFLDGNRGRVPVAGPDAFVGRRRSLQRALRALRATEGAGVLLTGLGQQGKSSLAARIARRMTDHSVVVCHGADELYPAAILARLLDSLGQADSVQAKAQVTEVGEAPGRLQEYLLHLLRRLDRPVLLVLDDLEQVLDSAAPIHVREPLHGVALRAVLGAFSTEGGRSGSRVLLTSRLRPVLPDARGAELVSRTLVEVTLEGMSCAERALLPAARQAEGLPASVRARCLEASDGNPGLVALLLGLAADLEARGGIDSLSGVLEALQSARETGQEGLDRWLEGVVGVLLQRLTEPEHALLRASTVFVVPIPLEALGPLLAALGVDDRVEARLQSLGLWVRVPDLVQPDRFAVGPSALVAGQVRPLGSAEASAYAGKVLSGLQEAWRTGDGLAGVAVAMTRLALVAGDASVVERHSHGAVHALLRWHEIPAARGLGRAAVQCLQTAGRPVPVELTVLLSEALEGTSTEEALQLLPRDSMEPAVVFRRGKLLARLGQIEEAERQLLAAEEHLPERSRDRALLKGTRADLLQARGQFDEALQIREEELSVYDKLGDLYSRTLTVGRMADILQIRGRWNEALSIRLEELSVYERLGEVRIHAVTFGKVADVLQMQGELDKALQIRMTEELPVYERLGDERERAVALGKVADIHHARGQLEEALRIRTHEVIPVLERVGDVRERAEIQARIAEIFVLRGQLVEAERLYVEEVLPVQVRLGNVRGEAITRGKRADLLQLRGQLEEALQEYAHVRDIFERLGDIRHRAVASGKMADIYTKQRRLGEALRIRAEEELPTYLQVGDRREYAVTLDKIADLFVAGGELEEAICIWIERVIPIFEQLGARRDKAVTLTRVAWVEGFRKHWQEAERLYREQLSVFEEAGDAQMVVVTRSHLGQVLLSRGSPSDRAEATALIRSAVLEARRHGFGSEAESLETILRSLGEEL